MSKLTKLLQLKTKLTSFLVHIPKSRSIKIEKDIEELFKNIENKNYFEMEEIEKIANVKISAMNRIYGITMKNMVNNDVKLKEKIITDEEKENKNNIDDKKKNENLRENIVFMPIKESNQEKNTRIAMEEVKMKLNKKSFNSNNEELLSNKNKIEEKVIKEDDVKRLFEKFEYDENHQWTSRYEEIKGSDGFNKEKVKVYQTEFIERYKKDLILERDRNKLYLINRIRNMRKEGKAEEIKKEFDDINFYNSELFDEKRNFNMEKFREIYIGLYNVYFEQGGEEAFRNLDMKEIRSKMKDPDIEINKINPYKQKEFNDIIGEDITEINSQNFDSRESNYDKELFKDDSIKENDGYIEMGGMGDFKVVMFEDVKERKEKKVENEDKQSEVREKFIWRDGNLVEGEALKRKVVSHINWNSSNLDPKDVKRHRELLHRQHFSGPLWEGIDVLPLHKRDLVLNEDMFENMYLTEEESKKEYDEVVKKVGIKEKNKFEDIVR